MPAANEIGFSQKFPCIETQDKVYKRNKTYCI